jgi:hypothetical protein
MALQDSYTFLNSYLSKIAGTSETPDDKPLEDDNDFYDVQDEDDQVPVKDDGYGIEQPNDDDTNSDEYGNGNEDAPLSNDDIIMGMGSGASPSDTPGNLGKSIASRESQGKYNATNKHSSATGKYQFLWSAWGDSIKKVTGVKDRQEFLNSPKAQDSYYAWYEKNYLMPVVEKLKPYNKTGLSDQELARLIHYRGATGAKKYLQGQLADQPEKYNIPISKYIAQHQAGGHGVAMSSGAKSVGLNNGSFSTMSFPMDGYNEFRGLDDGTPVYLEDEDGKKKILKGKRHKAIMRGNVFEKRLK